jgi:CRP/FNR family transcriptional regulator, nitrogen oxide reductase regulator
VKAPLLLAGLTDGEQRELLAAARPRQLQPRDVLGQQGDAAEIFALVQIGHLKLAQVNPAGVETLVRWVGPGDCYGAIALVVGSRYPLSAIAVEPSRVLVWTRPVISGFAERLPRLKSNILEEITRRMTGVLSMAQELATSRAPQRLARALLRLAEQGGTQTPDGVHIAHPITRQELADLTGTTLFTVSRLMSRWESEGLLRTRRGDVTVVDPEGLELVSAAEDSGE